MPYSFEVCMCRWCKILSIHCSGAGGGGGGGDSSKLHGAQGSVESTDGASQRTVAVFEDRSIFKTP